MTTKTRSEPSRFASRTTIVLPLLLVACATSGGPAAVEAPPEAVAEPVAVEAPVEAAAEPTAVAAYLDDAAAITAGRRMFRAVCTGYCHSTTPGVTKDAPNLFDCDWDHGNTDADLYRVINRGVPDTEMLPFEGKIPEDTIWKVIAYMRSNSLDCG
ncbi:MAG: c-type cytochrome [Acidobacteriota bacterium]|nr:c-type cytochrome [Acidobacteriota bacterium]